jgi:hypothetical protein
MHPPGAAIWHIHVYMPFYRYWSTFASESGCGDATDIAGKSPLEIAVGFYVLGEFFGNESANASELVFSITRS